MSADELIAALQKLSAKDRQNPVLIEIITNMDGSDCYSTDVVWGVEIASDAVLLQH